MASSEKNRVGRARRALVFTSLLAAATMGALVASCGSDDQVCPTDADPDDVEDDCPFGLPGGPEKTQSAGDACPDIVFDKTDCDVSFVNDVYPRLTALNGGNCTGIGCHTQGSLGGNKIILPPGMPPDDFYNALSAYLLDDAPYLGPDAANAFILCNVLAQPGGGIAMPLQTGLVDEPAADDDNDVALITQWVNCGMVLDEGGGGVGGGGGGGIGGGGIGGIGGAGVGGIDGN